MEKWKAIKGYEGIYEVSNYGVVKSFHKNNNGVFISQHTEKCNHTNYKALTLSKDKVKTQFRVHRLVAEAFIDNPENKCCVNHKDNNGENNHYSNLEWTTQSENIQHSHNQGRLKEATDKANKVQSNLAKMKRENMVGEVYGKWTVLKALEREYKGKTVSKMLCKCECGNEKEVDMISLKQGRSTQCKSCSTKEVMKKRHENTK